MSTEVFAVAYFAGKSAGSLPMIPLCVITYYYGSFMEKVFEG